MLTFEKFIDQFVNKCQITNNDINEMIFLTINFVDLDNVNFEDNVQSKDILLSLGDKPKLLFNENALASCIKSGFLSKYLSESASHFPKFLKVILNNYASNKILSKI